MVHVVTVRRPGMGSSPRLAPPGGYSAVELVIVIMLIGIFSAVAIPRYVDSLSAYRADAAARRIVVDVHQARNEAENSSSSRTIAFTVAENGYQLNDTAGLNRASAGYVVRLAGDLYQAKLASVDFSGASEVTFDGFGRPDTGGTIVVQSGNHVRTIVVNGETGKATIP